MGARGRAARAYGVSQLPGHTISYRYRARARAQRRGPHPAADGAAAEREQLFQRLAYYRQLLSHSSSTIRALSAARNEMIAEALEDGLPVPHIAAATGETRRSIRSIGLAFDAQQRLGLPREVHLAALRGKSAELLAAERERTGIEEHREELIVIAHCRGLCDDLDLAAMSGLTPEHIRKTTRGSPRGSTADS